MTFCINAYIFVSSFTTTKLKMNKEIRDNAWASIQSNMEHEKWSTDRFYAAHTAIFAAAFFLKEENAMAAIAVLAIGGLIIHLLARMALVSYRSKVQAATEMLKGDPVMDHEDAAKKPEWASAGKSRSYFLLFIFVAEIAFAIYVMASDSGKF